MWCSPRRVARVRIEVGCARLARMPALLSIVFAGFVAGCARTPPPQSPAVPRHLVLITIDTLRADRLGVYGAVGVATPRLDAIARAGVMARDASAHVPITLPSHVSLMTGLLPAGTGIRDNITADKVPAVPLLAEVLHQASFATGAFVSSVVLSSFSGLNRGFDAYADQFEGGTEARFLSSVRKRGDVTTAQAIEWLESTRERARERRLFLWLHLFDPHDPYEPPEPYASRYSGRPYDGAVAWTDELVGRLDDAIARLGLRDDTLLVVTSDHGEGLGEHGELLHGFFVYQSTLRVPWLARGPGIRPNSRLDTTVRLVDVFPTVLDLLNVPRPHAARLDGRSLAPALHRFSGIEEPTIYAETLVPLLHFGWSDLRVLREGRWKYIQAPRPELYDLSTDPGEQRNVIAAQPSRARAMRGGLASVLAAERRALGDGRERAQAVPGDLLERLGALGYVHVGDAQPTPPANVADPKDKVQDFQVASDLIRQGLLRYHAREYQASVTLFRQVLALGVEGFEVHLFLARALAAIGKPRDAAKHFEIAAGHAPSQLSAWEGLADNLIAARDPQGALGAIARAKRALPDAASLHIREARLLRDLGRLPPARQAYEQALPLAPHDGGVRCELGEVLRDLGEVDAAIARLDEAVDLNPDSAECWNSLAVTLGGARRSDEAERAFRNAAARAPGNHYYSYNLGRLLLDEGRADEARGWFEKSLAANPHFAPARQSLVNLSRDRR
jgi:choline-sulfatase